MLPTLGIVGGIGSGKSVVARALQALGGHLIAADPIGHDALRQADIKAKLVHRWGAQILDCQGNPDRKKIAAVVFSKETERHALEALVFPCIGQRIADEIAAAQARPDEKFIILDAAVMLEAGWHRRCDHILFIEAPRELRLARLREKRGWDDAELDRREAAQMPLDEKRCRADAVVVNDENEVKVADQVRRLLLQWHMI